MGYRGLCDGARQGTYAIHAAVSLIVSLSASGEEIFQYRCQDLGADTVCLAGKSA